MTTLASTTSGDGHRAGIASAAPAVRARLQSIDALRGFVMVLMLLDHLRETWFLHVPMPRRPAHHRRLPLRETWFLHVPMPDPIDARVALPALYLARLAASLCAPVFIVLTGIAAFLFHSRHTARETRAYLLKRGLVLMALDALYLSELYWGVASPTLWLQVIWCIGVCMIVLAAAIGLPRWLLLGIGLVIVCGHNLLDAIRLVPGQPLFPLWAMLHQRDVIVLPFGLVAKTTYPVLPWIGVILLGWSIGPWFLPDVPARDRMRRLVAMGGAMLAGFAVLRFANMYGDASWFVVDGSAMRTLMSVFALTKYPPSVLFLLLTLGIGALLLAGFERWGGTRLAEALAVFGGAPMFFYLFHLTVLRLLYHAAFAIWGATHGSTFGVESYGWVLVWYVGLIVPLYLPTVWFSRFKAARRDIAWLKYL